MRQSRDLQALSQRLQDPAAEKNGPSADEKNVDANALLSALVKASRVHQEESDIGWSTPFRISSFLYTMWSMWFPVNFTSTPSSLGVTNNEYGFENSGRNRDPWPPQHRN